MFSAQALMVVEDLLHVLFARGLFILQLAGQILLRQNLPQRIFDGERQSQAGHQVPIGACRILKELTYAALKKYHSINETKSYGFPAGANRQPSSAA
jgi:hypothetical protein